MAWWQTVICVVGGLYVLVWALVGLLGMFGVLDPRPHAPSELEDEEGEKVLNDDDGGGEDNG